MSANQTAAEAYLQRRTWARGRLILAWLTLTRVAAHPDTTLEQLEHRDRELQEAIAVAMEWAIEPGIVIREAEALA